MPFSFPLGNLTYTFSDETLWQMLFAMERTVTRERGFSLCGSRDNIMPGKQKRGGPRGMLPSMCVNKEQTRGFFHTHPDGDATLSEDDWESILINSYKYQVPYLLCSGANGDVWCTTVDDVKTLYVPKRLTAEVIEEPFQKLLPPVFFTIRRENFNIKAVKIKG